MNKLYSIVISFFILIVFFSCQKEEKAPVGTNKITIGSTAPTTISYTTATVSAAIESIKGNKAIQYGHCWGIAQSPVVDGSKTSLGSLSEAKTFNSQLENLLPNTSYFIRAYVTTQYETIYGSEATFKTIDYTKPTVTTTVISGATPYLAVSGGNVTADGGLPVTARGVVWNTASEPSVTSKVGITTDGTGTGSFTSQITNLLPGTTYYLRSYATSSKDTGYGEQFTFTTKSISAPELITNAVTGILSTSAISGGNVTNDGNLAVTARGVVWNTTTNPTLTSKTGITLDGSGIGSFISQIINLQPSTSYYVRAYATNSMGTAYGNELNFKTNPPPTLATLTTSTPSNISSTSATLGGTVTSDGNAAVTERGVCYSISSSPTTSNTKLAIGSGTGSFNSVISGLTANTTYYVRAYAINSQGTAYGNEQSYKTNIVFSLASITTSTPDNIISNSAILGGNVTSDGNVTVTERGICYDTSQNPTTSNTKVANGSGTGSFSGAITGLTANTTYYIRAYAINSQGTAYGNEIVFSTPVETVTDIDGNIYHTVTIGTQVWMVENLKTTKYNDGTLIPNITDNTTWYGRYSAAAYCWYNNDALTYKPAYGALYNWSAVNTGNLAPQGWHVPTDLEWSTLTSYLGGESIAGGKLKEIGKTNWVNFNIGATNETGFSGLPGGIRNGDGTFNSIGNGGLFWSSTQDAISGKIWYRELLGQNATVLRNSLDLRIFGLSVRCVKD